MTLIHQSNSSAGSDDIAHARMLEKLRRELGDVVLAALEDPATIDVIRNPSGRLWHTRVGAKKRLIGTMGAAQAEALIRTLSTHHEKSTTKKWPLLECELPIGNCRFTGQLPGTVSSPSFSIRKHAASIYTLAEYREAGIITAAQEMVLVESIRDRKNIVVVGGCGTGKTTLANALIAEMVRQFPDAAFRIIEDTGELQCDADDVIQYHTTPEVGMTDLLRTVLRMAPDRIIVGEVRGGEALDLLDCWGTGHPGGVATLHANPGQAGLSRLVSLVSRNKSAPRDIKPLIGDAVDVIVNIVLTEKSRKVSSIELVSGFYEGRFITTTLQEVDTQKPPERRFNF